MDGITVPILNFGNSDDRGKSLIPGVKKSHLFHCKTKFKIKAFQAVVQASLRSIFLAMILWLKYICLFEEIVRLQGKKLKCEGQVIYDRRLWWAVCA